jgi:SAM-dependent methyltransferase
LTETTLNNSSQSPPLWSIALLAAAALAYEVLLTRLFAIIQWHHFAYMIVSLALLGYGASGSFLALLGDRVERYFRHLFTLNAGLFGITAVGGFLLAQRIPFNALEIAWNPLQLGYLALIYVLLAVPFFCVANCFGLTFLAYREQTHRIYAFDLLGAGAGALLIIGLLFLLHPLTALLLLGVAGLLAAAVSVRRLLLPALALALLVLWPGSAGQLQLSEYKALSQALRVVGAQTLTERHGPLGLLQVVGNDRVPFRYAPGLSLAAAQGPGAQLGLFSDGGQLGVITRLDGNGDGDGNGDIGQLDHLDYLDYLTSALPYHLLERPQTLVLGAGAGADVLQALYHGAASVDAVELNGQIVDLVRDDFSDYAGGIYERPGVNVHIAEARSFIAGSRRHYDLIQIALLDAYSTAAAGLYALNESYLYTVEALQEYWRHLNPDGLLAVTRWLRLPPRDSVKLFATAVTALEQLGIEQPAEQLMLIRGWKTSTLLLNRNPFSADDIAALKAFCRDRSFDLVYYPGIQAVEANRYNRLEQPYLYQAAQAILSDRREDFLQRYKFDVRPATDDKPFFFHFFKWQTLPELLSLRAGSGLSQLEWGYMVLLATLLQALLAGVVLILLPLWLGRRRRIATPPDTAGRAWVLLYFAAIGLGFLLLEIAFIQKFVLFLGHPLYAVAVVLCAFLLGAGCGSRYADAMPAPYLAPLLIVVLVLLYLWLLPLLFAATLAWPVPVRIVLAVGLIGPLAFFMGMPFPDGLSRITQAYVAWAWAINGCASVVSAVLATLLAMRIGFAGVAVTAAACYLLTLGLMVLRNREGTAAGAHQSGNDSVV